MLVEADGGLIDGVDDHGANGKLLGGERHSPQRVAQQCCAEAAVLVAVVTASRARIATGIG